MNFLYRRRDRRADRLEQWFHAQYLQFILEKNISAPSSPHPGHEFLASIAEHSNDVSLLDERLEHVGQCPSCLRSIIDLRTQWSSRRKQRNLNLSLSLTVVLVALIVVLFSVRRNARPSQVASQQISLDLRTLSRARGLAQQPPSRPIEISLPRTQIQLHVRLPIGVPPTNYQATLYPLASTNPVTQARGFATNTPGGLYVPFALDLRNLTPGQYRLEIRSDDPGPIFSVQVHLTSLK